MLSVCGSITTWGGLNPSFCVYELDRETLLPVTRQTWSFDIATANEKGLPEWSIYTDWLSDYKMADLSPASYFDFAKRLSQDEELNLAYRMKQGRRMSAGSSCDAGCLQQTYCDSVFFDPYLNRECKGEPIFDWTGRWLGSLREAMMEPWLKPVDQSPEKHHTIVDFFKRHF